MQQNDEKNVEKLMDEYLRANGLYRKKIAKDGSCLFRAVAEQVLHCQGLHTRVRAECVKYLRQKRDLYESFIEGDFEEYLLMLQDPQSWVGQVEISALAVLYKHDFIIYRQPGKPPANVTEHGYPKKVLLCFLNENHYDSVYPESFAQNAAVCQSILYELLYERVYGVDRSVLTPSLKANKAKNGTIEAEDRESSGDSDLDDGQDFWSSEATGKPAGVNSRKAYKGRGRGQARGVGRGCLLRKVQESLNPTTFRNVEYQIWLRSNRVQHRRDFCMAAGMYYKAGDKCQVRLNNSNRFYSAHIQDVSPDNGPVTVFIEELAEKYTVPLWNLRTPSEDSWSTVTEKSKSQTASSSSGTRERDTRPVTTLTRSVSHGPTASANHIQQQHSWPPLSSTEPQSLGTSDGSRRSNPSAGEFCVLPVEENEHALLEILNKDEENFPPLEASVQAASVEGSRRAEKKGSRKKAGAETKAQSLNPVNKAEKGKAARNASVDQDQRVTPPSREDPSPTPSITLSAPSASKSTKAAASSTTALARVPYKISALSARIPPVKSGNPLTAPAPPTRPQDSSQTTSSQPQSVPATSRPVVEAQAAPDPSAVIPVSPQTTPMPVTSVPSPKSSPCTHANGLTRSNPVTANSLPQKSSQSIQSHASNSTLTITTPVPLGHGMETTPTITTPVPLGHGMETTPTITTPVPLGHGMETTPTITTPVPLGHGMETTPTITTPVPLGHGMETTPTITTPVPLGHGMETTPTITTPVPLGHGMEATATPTITTPVPLGHGMETTPNLSQTTTIPVSTDKPAPNLVSTTLFSPSQTTSATLQGSSSAPSQIITPSAEMTGLTHHSPPVATPSEPSASACVTTQVHVPYSPAQPASSYPVEFGTHLSYPPVSQTPPFSQAAESYLHEPAVSPVSAGIGSTLVTNPLAQLCQDIFYPGFPQNDKNEHVQIPPFSVDSTGDDLPNDTSVLRFFFNLGVKAFMYQMFPPVSYLEPLRQAYHYIQLQVPHSPVSWQPDNNFRPVITSSNPSPAGSSSVSHFELHGMVPSPPRMEIGAFSHTSLPMQMPMPVASHPGMCPVSRIASPLQYPAPPTSLGIRHHSVPAPHPYATETPMPTASPILQGAQEGQRSLTPQVEKTFWANQRQQPSQRGDSNSGPVPVTMEMQHGSGAQAVLSGTGPETTPLTNGNTQSKGGGFSGASLEHYETRKAEFGDAGLQTEQRPDSQPYKSESRHGQDDRGGSRGRGSRSRRDYPGCGRHDGQLPYHKGSGGRSRGRGYSNTKGAGFPNRQFTRAPES